MRYPKIFAMIGYCVQTMQMEVTTVYLALAPRCPPMCPPQGAAATYASSRAARLQRLATMACVQRRIAAVLANLLPEHWQAGQLCMPCAANTPHRPATPALLESGRRWLERKTLQPLARITGRIEVQRRRGGRSPVPQRDDAVGELAALVGVAEGARQPKVRQLEDALVVDEQVAGLQVPVQHLRAGDTCLIVQDFRG